MLRSSLAALLIPSGTASAKLRYLASPFLLRTDGRAKRICHGDTHGFHVSRARQKLW